MSERLSGIDVFVAAVEAGNFAGAALRMGLTRSAVAKSVGRLETRLGTRLFRRTTRSQSLTDDGQAYYERCRRALAELEAADAVFEAGRREPAGRLRLTMPELIGRRCVAPLLLALGRQHARLSFEVSFDDRRVDLVEDGIDLAIRSGPLGDSSSVAARALGHQWVCVVASPDYLARHGRPSCFEEMAARRDMHAFVGYGRQGSPKPWLHRDERGAPAAFDPRARFVFDSLEVVADAARDGLGLARVPHWLVEPELATGRLVQVFAEPHPYGYELHAVWPHARALPLKVRVLVDLLVQQLLPRMQPPGRMQLPGATPPPGRT
jgi:DNA-binding transcriptional LysR family regulator